MQATRIAMHDPSGRESNGWACLPSNPLGRTGLTCRSRVDFDNSRLSQLLVLFWPMKSYSIRPVFACRHWLKNSS
jgi:hypothetical protein